MHCWLPRCNTWHAHTLQTQALYQSFSQTRQATTQSYSRTASSLLTSPLRKQCTIKANEECNISTTWNYTEVVKDKSCNNTKNKLYWLESRCTPQCLQTSQEVFSLLLTSTSNFDSDFAHLLFDGFIHVLFVCLFLCYYSRLPCSLCLSYINKLTYLLN